MAEYKAENELDDELFEHHRFEAAKGQSSLKTINCWSSINQQVWWFIQVMEIIQEH